MLLRSLNTRLVLLFLGTLLLAGTVFAVLAARVFDDYQRHQSEQSLLKQAPAVASLLAQTQEQAFLSSEPVSAVAQIEAMTSSRVYFASFHGLALPTGSVARFPAAEATRINWPTIERHRAQTLYVSVPPGGSRSFAVAVGIFFREARNRPIGAIVLVRPIQALSPSVLVQTQRVLVPALVGVGGALLVALFLSRRITRPVEELTAASERIARGDYDVRIQHRGPDELGVLSQRFEQMAARLRESSELERSFLMRISHELRTPLTSIQGHVQAITDGVIDDPDEQRASLEIVQAESARLERLIGDLLDLAKLEARRFSLQREQVELRELCGQAIGAQAARARRSEIDVTLEADEPVVVVADGDRVLQIVGNLLANALRWTPPGGEVTIRVERGARAARVHVLDTGPGVPSEMREHVLRPFVSGDPSGTGLGLAVANELANAMGGSLTVSERQGGGAAFMLMLPISSAAAELPGRAGVTTA